MYRKYCYRTTNSIYGSSSFTQVGQLSSNTVCINIQPFELSCIPCSGSKDSTGVAVLKTKFSLSSE